MPQELENELRRKGRKKGLKGKRLDAYVYGVLRKTGWRPKRERGLPHPMPD
jgi:hypothetical protein